MRKLLRYLLLSISVAALTSTIANAAITDLNATTPEIIPKSYVTVTPDLENHSVPDSLIESIVNLVLPIESKIYSLLQWKTSQRPTELEVTSYSRVLHFGKWAQDRQDTTCYNTRAKVLIRDSATPVIFAADNACSVDKGQWNDPYGGKVLTDAKAEIQIDHMIPLKNAYISGAYRWDYKARCLYANYLGENYHLISVDGMENQRKGDKAPDQFMPLNKQYSCTYLKNWLSVKTLWGLEMTAGEAKAISQLLKSEHCDPKDFVISEVEVQAQRKFASTNADLCADYSVESK